MQNPTPSGASGRLDPAMWAASKTERRKVADLIPYARNSRTHSDEQIAQLAASIKEWGWTIPILVDETGGIIAGHGRVMAARKLRILEVPVMVARGWTEAQKRAYVIADNQLALNSDWDKQLLSVEIADLKELNFDLTLTGLDAETIEGLDDVDLGGEEADTAEKAEPVDEPRHLLLVLCQAEDTQADLFKEMKARGYTVKVV